VLDYSQDFMGSIQPQTFQLKNGDSVTIRSAQEADAEAYLNLCKRITSEEIYSLNQPSELTFTVEQEAQWLKSNIDNDCHLVLVAEVSGKIVGQLDFSNGLKKLISHTGEFGMGVHKDYRGLGIGAFLLGELINWAQEHPQIEKINLCVHRTNDRAIAMYKKFGFVQEGIRTKDLKYSNDVYVDTVLMGLEIKNNL
jgi:RimJ/RimL family protein N-acetyltransferase